MKCSKSVLIIQKFYKKHYKKLNESAKKIQDYYKKKKESLKERDKLILKMKLEAEKIERNLNDRDYIITLEIEGKEYDSVEFAEKLRNIQIENSNIVFIIGGSYGLADSIKEKAKMHLSFSKMTFPHQLFRVLLLEQIYRAFKINNNESYHK